MTSTNIKVVKSGALSKPWDDRYVVIEESTGKVLDDAQGYGYKSAQNAHAAWEYKSASKSTKKKRADKKRRVEKWVREHQSVMDDLEEEQLYAFKDDEDPDVKAFFAQRGVELPFTVADLMKYG